VQFAPTSQMAGHKNRLLIAGIAAIGASLIPVNLMTAGSDLPSGQHRAVKLVAGEETWSEVVAATEANVQTIEGASSTAGTELSGAVSALTGGFGDSITDAIKGTITNLELSLSGGWYGNDDGYVFGLFPGSLSGPDGVETGSTLQEISTALQGGQYEQAFSYFDTWSLETADHTLKALLNPLLDVTSHGTTTLSIPVELSEIQTQLLTQFGSYTELKDLSDAVLSPFLGVAFGLSQDIDTISTEVAAGDYSDALSNVFNLPSDLTGDFLNGWGGGSTEAFTGLLSVGETAGTASILQDLLVLWPEQLASALTLPVTDITTDPITGIVTDVIGGL
jgi:hypothetical protein